MFNFQEPSFNRFLAFAMAAFCACFLLLNSIPLSAETPSCEESLLTSPVLKSERRASFYSRSYRSGELLLSFFGPTSNIYHEWMEWLKSNDPSHAPSEGPGLYYSPKGQVIARPSSSPFDFGSLDEMGLPERTGVQKILPILDLPGHDIGSYRGDSPQVDQGRELIESLINRELFGVYSLLKSKYEDREADIKLTEIRTNPALEVSINPSVHPPRVRKTLWGEDIYPPDEPDVLDDFYSVVEDISMRDDSVVIKVSMDFDAASSNDNQNLIRKMFFITYWQMVQKTYRESGLFPNEFQSSIYLLDDFIQTMKTSGPGQDLYMMYDTAAWNSMITRMLLAHRFIAYGKQAPAIHPFYHHFTYQTIPDIFAPFYPIYGLTTERYPTGELEVKRLFHNKDPDPLGLIASVYGPFPDSRKLNTHFYHSIAHRLPRRTQLRASSKTKIHTRLYKSLGFALLSSEFKEEWGTNKDTLGSTREDFLEATQPKP